MKYQILHVTTGSKTPRMQRSRTCKHIAEHGLTPDDVEGVICDPLATTYSRSSKRPVATGYTTDGRLILVIYEQIDESTVYPVTAYELED